jgi:hypothetical protein
MTEQEKNQQEEPKDEQHADLEVTDEDADEVKGGSVHSGRGADKGPNLLKGH